MNAAFIIFELLPLATFLLTGVRKMITMVQLPYFDPESNVGYVLNIINQTVLSNFVVFCNVGHDCALASIINTMWAGSDVIKYSIDQMVERYRETHDVVEHKYRMRNILIQIQDLDRYLYWCIGGIFDYHYLILQIYIDADPNIR